MDDGEWKLFIKEAKSANKQLERRVGRYRDMAFHGFALGDANKGVIHICLSSELDILSAPVRSPLVKGTMTFTQCLAVIRGIRWVWKDMKDPNGRPRGNP